MAADTSENVFELVTGQDLDALEDGTATVALHGLKNELSRLHELLPIVDRFSGMNRNDVWTRIVVIQEALLDVARWMVKKT
ncbi:MAG: hypothetical protein WC485_01895 [Opitutaceae bacterium]